MAGNGAGELGHGRELTTGRLLAWATTLGGLAWPLAVVAATAGATRLTLTGRPARRCLVARRLLA